jgi:hypothetical protein
MVLLRRWPSDENGRLLVGVRQNDRFTIQGAPKGVLVLSARSMRFANLTCSMLLVFECASNSETDCVSPNATLFVVVVVGHIIIRPRLKLFSKPLPQISVERGEGYLGCLSDTDLDKMIGRCRCCGAQI